MDNNIYIRQDYDKHVKPHAFNFVMLTPNQVEENRKKNTGRLMLDLPYHSRVDLGDEFFLDHALSTQGANSGVFLAIRRPNSTLPQQRQNTNLYVVKIQVSGGFTGEDLQSEYDILRKSTKSSDALHARNVAHNNSNASNWIIDVSKLPSAELSPAMTTSELLTYLPRLMLIDFGCAEDFSANAETIGRNPTSKDVSGILLVCNTIKRDCTGWDRSDDDWLKGLLRAAGSHPDYDINRLRNEYAPFARERLEQITFEEVQRIVTACRDMTPNVPSYESIKQSMDRIMADYESDEESDNDDDDEHSDEEIDQELMFRPMSNSTFLSTPAPPVQAEQTIKWTCRVHSANGTGTAWRSAKPAPASTEALATSHAEVRSGTPAAPAGDFNSRDHH
ncbi:hypothetical protein EJ08DRAFT_739506 [Tothia fuscella]|uniref:Uncharacterized protein n=1 Tax=Tothia fuscella TaxID=1048955 RepID=A0A9P4NE89_9PEZI|nr:hypothetical protein EJ08DRAFT_739506 [Tothia fuscella]